MITIIKIAMTVGYVWVGLMAAGVMIAGTGVLTQKAQRGVEKFLKMQAKGIGAAMAICFFMIAAGIAAGLWMSM